METGIAFVLMFLAILTPDGKLHADMRPLPACPDQQAIVGKLEADKQAGTIKDYFIQCTVPVRPVEQRGANRGSQGDL